jgi:DNA (cytosine-5)-methyltransferase 1
MKIWRLLDLLSGAGGAAYGYRRAGFHVTGVDHTPQPRYRGDVFVQGDALEYLRWWGDTFDVIHASPPCQPYSVLTHLARSEHQALIAPVRATIHETRKPYVIENVLGAPLHNPLLLCGSMFGLATACGAHLRRHRLFECPLLLMTPGHCQHGTRTLSVNGHAFRHEATRWEERRTITVTGSTPQQNVERNRIRETFSIEAAREAMGIDWMVMQELSQAIPPAYTEWIGRQLLTHLTRREETP